MPLDQKTFAEQKDPVCVQLGSRHNTNAYITPGVEGEPHVPMTKFDSSHAVQPKENGTDLCDVPMNQAGEMLDV